MVRSAFKSTNTMKTDYILQHKIKILCVCIGLTIAGWTQTGCQNATIPDAMITASVAAGTSAGLKLAVKDAAKQKVIANYLNTYAGALRTISGNPTDEQLTAQLMAFVPPNIQSEYPELSSFAVPLIVSFYDWAKSKYGTNTAELYKVLNDVATGIEQGAACCLHASNHVTKFYARALSPKEIETEYYAQCGCEDI